MSRAPATGDTGNDGFTAVAPADVTDEVLLPRRFDAFAVEMRDAFEMLGDKILPFMERIETKLVDAIERIGKLERHAHRTDDRLDALEKKLKTKRKARK